VSGAPGRCDCRSPVAAGESPPVCIIRKAIAATTRNITSPKTARSLRILPDLWTGSPQRGHLTAFGGTNSRQRWHLSRLFASSVSIGSGDNITPTLGIIE
jgi:hypothetical protein